MNMRIFQDFSWNPQIHSNPTLFVELLFNLFTSFSGEILKISAEIAFLGDYGGASLGLDPWTGAGMALSSEAILSDQRLFRVPVQRN